jgi:hypothetical protein
MVLQFPSLLSIFACVLQLLERDAANVVASHSAKPYLQ